MERSAFPLELKLAAGAITGAIEGYGAVFGNADSHGDVILPGAFARSLAERKGSGRPLPSMFLQHGGAMGADPRPVGVWTAMEEDSRGLKVAGQLSGLDTETGRYNLALIRDGAMRGLSIGYRVSPGGASHGDGKSTPVRTLSALELLEVSIVSDPSNSLAIVSGLKAAHRITSAREFEGLLTDLGFPRAAARKLTAGGWGALASQPDDTHDLDLKLIADRLDQIAAEIKRA